MPAPPPQTFESCDNPLLWDFQPNDRGEDEYSTFVTTQTSSSHLSAELGTAATTNDDNSGFNILNRGSADEISVSALESRPDFFYSITEQNSEPKKGNEILSDAVSPSRADVKENFISESQTGQVHFSAGQNFAGTPDDNLGNDVHLRRQEGDRQDTSIQSDVSLSMPPLLSNDRDSDDPQLTQGVSERFGSESSVPTSAVASAIGHAIPFAIESEQGNSNFVDESTDWFDKTATQLEDMSNLYEGSVPGPSMTLGSESEHVTRTLHENTLFNTSDAGGHSLSYSDGNNAETLSTEKIASPVILEPSTTTPVENESEGRAEDLMPVCSESFDTLTNATELVNRPGYVVVHENGNPSHHNVDNFFQENFDKPSIDARLETSVTGDSVQMSKDVNWNPPSSGGNLFYSEGNTALGAETSVAENVVLTEDVDWFSDQLSPGRETEAKPFTEIINGNAAQMNNGEDFAHISSAEVCDGGVNPSPNTRSDDLFVEDDAPSPTSEIPLSSLDENVSRPDSIREAPPSVDMASDSTSPFITAIPKQLDDSSESGQQGYEIVNPPENQHSNHYTEPDVSNARSTVLCKDEADFDEKVCSTAFQDQLKYPNDTGNELSEWDRESTGNETSVLDFELQNASFEEKQDAFSVIGSANQEERGFSVDTNQIGIDTDQQSIADSQGKVEEDVGDCLVLTKKVEELEELLRLSRSELNSKENAMNQKLIAAETETEVAKLERQEIEEMYDLLRNEVSTLHQSEKEKSKELAASNSKLKELELELNSNLHRKDSHTAHNGVSHELLKEEMGRLKQVTDEKNLLFDEKERLLNDRDELKTELDEMSKKSRDWQRELMSLGRERDELKGNYDGVVMQMKEHQKQIEAVTVERDRLLRDRAAYSSASSSEREKALAAECEHRARALAITQKKLTSATSKIEKLTIQRSTFLRQRDDAGARLRAAGSEFTSLNDKLRDANKAKEALRAEMLAVRGERDRSLAKLLELELKSAELSVYKEDLHAKVNELDLTRKALMQSQEQFQVIVEERCSLHSQCESLKGELRSALSASEVANRKAELLESRIEQYEKETVGMNDEAQNLRASQSELVSKIQKLENDLASSKDDSTKALNLAQKRIAKEQEESRGWLDRLGIAEEKLRNSNASMEEIRTAVVCCLNLGKELLGDGLFDRSFDLASLDSPTFRESQVEASRAAKVLCDMTRTLCEEFVKSTGSRKELETMYYEANEKLQRVTGELQESRNLSNQIEDARSETNEAWRKVELLKAEKLEQDNFCADLRKQLEVAIGKESELLQQLSSLQEQFRTEREEFATRWSEEKAKTELLDGVLSKLQSVSSMLEKCIGEEQVQILEAELSQDEVDDSSRVGVMALRATALVVAELNRRRAEASDMLQKLESADAEVARLTDRSELAEQERDALKGVVDRVERKASSAHSAGQEEARAQFEGVVTQLEDELSEQRDEMRIAREKANRFEKEAGELRGLCNKLTSQLNGRTNELDEAEEKLAYLQDQVSTLEEDLHEAHRRLKQAEEESAETRRYDVEKLSRELENRCAELESVEKECVRLRDACDEAVRKAKEFEIEARTHQQAEKNLQIAIEQLEAEQESAVEQRTITLEKKARDAETAMEEANERARLAAVSESQLKLRDDEIKELRGALGKLADERVELKLELEKSLSRLHHPDAEEQLVDRRVVRQLLVSYFRVDSVRRRDVLQLMSRMLAFSESDNVAVGLKRRALMDRLGSLVQAPELDDASLPPLGTVSDKWIEFLMKEAEDGEDQERRW